MNNPLKRGFFGYSKSSVNLYIKEMNQSARRMIEEKNTEIKRLREECAKLREQKDAIAEAIIAAKKRAQEIVAASEKDAEEKRERLKTDYAREREHLDQVRGWINDVKKITAETLKRFEDALCEEENIALQKRRAAAPLEDGILGEDEDIFSAADSQVSHEQAHQNASDPVKPAIIKIK